MPQAGVTHLSVTKTKTNCRVFFFFFPRHGCLTEAHMLLSYEFQFHYSFVLFLLYLVYEATFGCSPKIVTECTPTVDLQSPRYLYSF